MIKIAFYWHQHQPYYKDNLTGEYSMPWVRLHGIKDYIGMGMLLEDFPEIHQTFNFVPCLLDQLKDYAENYAVDRFWKLSELPAEDLTEEDKLSILDNFFSANNQSMISVYPRYKELLKKRNFKGKKAHDVLHDFSHRDFQDLQVWTNLAWYHPLIVQKDTLLSELYRKGEGFTKEDKEFVLLKQREVIRQIIPLHKHLQDSKQIEITTSPYYHPILPLLCNQESARAVLPKLSLPKKRLFAGEDAKIQVERSVQAYEKYFGQKPRGVWPPEGAVSDDIIPILAQAGFHWLASDEEILAHSTGNQILRGENGEVMTPDILYNPYRIRIKEHDIHIVFRDHNLSDLIGFQYAEYPVDTAVSDFVARIRSLKKYRDRGKPLLVTILLDGENAWEYYPNSGIDFLRKLYWTMSNDNDVECVRICDYLEEHPPAQILHHVCPGSWIGHNLATWIGSEEKNMAWDFIEDARSFILNKTRKTDYSPKDDRINRAWEELFIAEGSDWFWWFGDDHLTYYKDEFDTLFRLHLKNVYKLFQVDPPKVLDAPISKISRRKPYTTPRRFLEVTLDGVVSNYFEWLDAGIYKASKDMDSMHKTYGHLIRNVYFGFDVDNLFIRIDFYKEFFSQNMERGKFVITFTQPHEIQIHTSILTDKPLKFKIKNKSQNHEGRDFSTISFNTIIELSCPFTDLGFSPGMDIEFFLEAVREDEVVQRVPMHTVFCLSVPSKDFERMMWQA